MKELKFICVEDDQLFMKKVVDCVTNYFAIQNSNVVFKKYTDVPNKLNLKGISACFFDIELNSCNTMDVIKNIRAQGNTVPIVVISQHKDYIFESVHMQIFDFIYKPNFDKDIENTLLRLKDVIYNTIEDLVINYKGRFVKIVFKDILYIHKRSHHFVIYDIYGSKREIWKNYDDIFVKNSTLIKVHKSYVININYCERIEKNEAFLKGCHKAIPISTRNYSSVTTKFALKHSLIK